MTTTSAELGGRSETAAQTMFVHFAHFFDPAISATSANLGRLDAAEVTTQVTACFSITSAHLGHFSSDPRRETSAPRPRPYKDEAEVTGLGHGPTSPFDGGGITPMESVSATARPSIFGPLTDRRLPGSCDDCDSFDAVSETEPRQYVLTTHHDPTCPWLRARLRPK
ncbi:hypothetical protein P9209_20860 [Prescottella defluvii]|nr:hypothetical protein P9209_20860 [Prescottella defluvii]